MINPAYAIQWVIGDFNESFAHGIKANQMTLELSAEEYEGINSFLRSRGMQLGTDFLGVPIMVRHHATA